MTISPPAAVAVRRIGPDDVPAVREFLAARTPEWRPQGRPGWLEWQYVENPAGFDVRLAESPEGIAGVSGFLPCRVSIDGTARTAAFSTNTLVDERSRGQGVGRALHEARLRDYDFALSSGQSAANHALYRKLGFAEAGRYRRLLVQTRRPALRMRRQWLVQTASWLRWLARGARVKPGVTVEVSRTVPVLEAACFTQRLEAGEIGPLWDREHLVWRYERHPYFRYSFVHVRDGLRDAGLAVVRAAAEETVLADLYGRVEDLPTLLGGVAAAVRPPIVGQFVGSRLAERFRRAGWTSLPSTNRLLGRSSDPALHRVLSTRPWCFFGGDSDADR